ncbi:MAG: HD domain-containing protein [Spirochaetaceae bacterium]|jgi:tRNA nucleotidyltransferase/poly(A) polymerase|nr:HD domain-containing protein [Spirochaetaceae bacterium]
MRKLFIHPILKEAAEVFVSRGKQVYLVGGAVRDLLLGKNPHDWDLASDATPEEVIAMFRRVIPTGIKHGTVTIRYRGFSIETTTFRTESVYSDGRRPDSVHYAATIEEDLSRRDFTMNAVAIRLPDGSISDPFGGREDIRKKLIRCVGRAEERFNEDGLRPLRALRFASQLDFALEETTLAAIPPALPATAQVAIERVREELDKMLVSALPSRGLRLMEQTGLLEIFLPELQRCRGVEQKGFHCFDVLDHSFLSCDFAAQDKSLPETDSRLVLCLAALLHDIGKPDVRGLDRSGVYTFYRHEEQSAALALDILRRFKYSNDIIEKTSHLIRQHMFHYEEAWSEAALRRFIIRTGKEKLPALYALRRADAYGTTGKAPPPGLLLPLMERVNGVLERKEALSLKDLALKGDDLMALGLKPGKAMGRILNELLEAVLADPELNTKEKLREIAGKIIEKTGIR